MNRSIGIGATFVVLCLAGLAGCGPAPATLVYDQQPVAAAQDVSGSWTTHWGSDEVCMLSLEQSGGSVSGSYTTTGAPPGNVSGAMNGNVLSGTWSDQAGGGGAMELTFSADGRSFQGTWGSGSSATNGGSWSGTR